MIFSSNHTSTPMPSRLTGYFYAKKWAYRYSFNGQERDDEIAGAGNIMTAEFWEYDTRLGRRWNLDPISYHWQSPYVTLNNNPIFNCDPAGLEGEKPGEQRTTTDGCNEVYNGKEWQDDKSILKEVVINGQRPSTKVNNAGAFPLGALTKSYPPLELWKNPNPGGALEKGLGLSGRAIGLTAALCFSPFDAGKGSSLSREFQLHQAVTCLLGQYNKEAAEFTLNNSTYGIPISYINEYNKKNKNDKIVFRYMSFQEAFFNGGFTYSNIGPKLNLTDKYITPDIYATSNSAKSFLQLPRAPDMVIWTFESQIQATKIPAVGWRPVQGNPQWGVGGGNEATINQPFPAKGLFLLPK